MAIRTEPTRLDTALQAVAKSASKPAERAVAERFAPVWRDRGRRDRVVGQRGLVDIEFDYIMPELGDSRVLRGADYLKTLESLLDMLNEEDDDRDGDDIDHWAAVLVHHEVRKFRLLWQYMNGLVD